MRLIRLLILFSLLLVCSIGKSQYCYYYKKGSENQFEIKGNKVYFYYAELKLINDTLWNGTYFPIKPPFVEDNDKPEMIQWLDSYRAYHRDSIALKRIKYFFKVNKTPTQKYSSYLFEIRGYYGIFQYKVGNNGSLYQVPAEWYWMKIGDVAMKNQRKK